MRNSSSDQPHPSTVQDLDEVKVEWSAFLKKRLKLWAIRWSIGFAAIWLVVAYYPQYAWLWWLGGGMALLALTLLLGGHFLVLRKIAEAERRFAEVSSNLEKHDAGPEA